MIYTHGLDRSTDHIMIYDDNTPVSVVKLCFNYNPNALSGNCVAEYDEAGWISRVATVLMHYANKFQIDVKYLSAKPIKIIPQWELVL